MEKFLTEYPADTSNIQYLLRSAAQTTGGLLVTNSSEAKHSLTVAFPGATPAYFSPATCRHFHDPAILYTRFVSVLHTNFQRVQYRLILLRWNRFIQWNTWIEMKKRNAERLLRVNFQTLKYNINRKLVQRARVCYLHHRLQPAVLLLHRRQHQHRWIQHRETERTKKLLQAHGFDRLAAYTLFHSTWMYQLEESVCNIYKRKQRRHYGLAFIKQLQMIKQIRFIVNNWTLVAMNRIQSQSKPPALLPRQAFMQWQKFKEQKFYLNRGFKAFLNCKQQRSDAALLHFVRVHVRKQREYSQKQQKEREAVLLITKHWCRYRQRIAIERNVRQIILIWRQYRKKEKVHVEPIIESTPDVESLIIPIRRKITNPTALNLLQRFFPNKANTIERDGKRLLL